MPKSRRDTINRPGKRRHRRRLFVFLLALLFGGLSGGFIAFAHHIDGLERPAALPKADGIVVWTGRGGGRLEAGADLLASGHGERLLISGVNRSISLEKLSELAGLSEAQAACCVDLDYAALDTRGNARETAAWAKALGYEHILLVTSAYHMPRARVEIAQETGRIRITPVPIQATERTQWWRDAGRFRRLFGEYLKYLLSAARGRPDTEGAVASLPELEAAPDADSPNTGATED